MEPRYILILIWTFFGVAGAVMGYSVLRYGLHNRAHAKADPVLSADEAINIAVKANLIKAVLLTVGALWILTIGIVALMSEAIPLPTRQWVSTFGLLYIGAMIDLLLLNELLETRKLLEAEEKEQP